MVALGSRCRPACARAERRRESRWSPPTCDGLRGHEDSEVRGRTTCGSSVAKTFPRPSVTPHRFVGTRAEKAQLAAMFDAGEWTKCKPSSPGRGPRGASGRARWPEGPAAASGHLTSRARRQRHRAPRHQRRTGWHGFLGRRAARRALPPFCENAEGCETIDFQFAGRRRRSWRSGLRGRPPSRAAAQSSCGPSLPPSPVQRWLRWARLSVRARPQPQRAARTTSRLWGPRQLDGILIPQNVHGEPVSS